jgi:hypothetical protein
MIGRTFDENLMLGRAGELLVSSWLRSRGYGIIESCNIRGITKTPYLMIRNAGIRMPDFIICKNGISSLLEIKTFHDSCFNRRHNCQVHGMNRDLFRGYEIVGKKTGQLVFIFVLEYLSSQLLGIEIKDMKNLWSCQCFACSNGNPQCNSSAIKQGLYWPRNDMKLIHTFANNELKDIRKMGNYRHRIIP